MCADPKSQPPRPPAPRSSPLGPNGASEVSKMVLSLPYGHHFREMVLSLSRNTTFHHWNLGFCPGWQNVLPGTLKSCSRSSMGTTFVKCALVLAKHHFSSLEAWILPTRQMRARGGPFSCSRRRMGTIEIMDYADFGFRPLEFLFSLHPFFSIP